MAEEVSTAVRAMLDLLTRADTLARLAVDAIHEGEDAALDALLAERDSVVHAILADSGALVPDQLPAHQRAVLARGAAAACASGERALRVAEAARDFVAGQLASLSARQQAAHEYHAGEIQHGAIDVLR